MPPRPGRSSAPHELAEKSTGPNSDKLQKKVDRELAGVYSDVGRSGGGCLSNIIHGTWTRQQILLGKAHQGPSQKGAQGQGVARVGDAPNQRDEILSLLPLEEILAGLRREGEPGLLEGPLVAP